MSKHKIPLSIIILTHRRDQYFVQALASAQIAEEVLVVDNNSDNDWQKLRKHYDFSVLKWPETIENFSQVRNRALKNVTQTWVLFLDSDEILPEESHEELAKLVKTSPYHGHTITRQDVFLGEAIRHGEAGKMKLLRLARRADVSYAGAVHETAHIPQEIADSSIKILHYSHESVADFIDAVSVYAGLVGRERSKAAEVGAWQNLFELIFFPPIKFIQNYFFKLGFLDGWRGLTYALIMSLHSLFVRISVYEQRVS